jgi:FAD:protein FMN transferase
MAGVTGQGYAEPDLISGSTSQRNGDTFCFTHEAMATQFRVVMAESDAEYAGQVARAAFEELDRIEGCLSRFIESSDVSRVNRLTAGRSTVVTPETFRCLQTAQQAKRLTRGAFDVGYASARKLKQSVIALDARDSSVTALGNAVRLDLGGIGKGFALDHMATVLRQWDIGHAILWASSSTVLALGKPNSSAGWGVHFGPEADRQQVTLGRSSLSASGNSVKGRHIIDPRTGRARDGLKRCWASASSAAMADALSTAFMILSEDEIRHVCRRTSGATAFLLKTDDSSEQIVRIDGRKSSDETT